MSYQKVILVGQVVHTPQYRKGGDGVIQATRLQLLTYMIALDECQRSVISREVLNEYAEGLRADLKVWLKAIERYL